MSLEQLVINSILEIVALMILTGMILYQSEKIV